MPDSSVSWVESSKLTFLLDFSILSCELRFPSLVEMDVNTDDPLFVSLVLIMRFLKLAGGIGGTCMAWNCCELKVNRSFISFIP